MASFTQARKWMQEGKKVFREGLRNVFEYLISNGCVFLDQDNQLYALSSYDLDINDWKIYEEETKEDRDECTDSTCHLKATEIRTRGNEKIPYCSIHAGMWDNLIGGLS